MDEKKNLLSQFTPSTLKKLQEDVERNNDLLTEEIKVLRELKEEVNNGRS